MDLFGTLLWPLRWLVEAVLVLIHGLFTALGLNPDAGLTWTLAIVGLLVIVRLAVLPLTLASVRSARKLAVIAPKLQELRRQHSGPNADAAALTQATLTLYREANTNPLGSIFPVLIQVPLFFALYAVLRNAQNDMAGVGLLGHTLTDSFANSTLLGAPLRLGLFTSGYPHLLAVGLTVVALTVVFQFTLQFVTYRFNTPREGQAAPLALLQKIPLVIVPVIILITSLAVQLGLNIYLAVSAFWSLVQQLLIIRYLPAPNSPAAKRWGAKK